MKDCHRFGLTLSWKDQFSIILLQIMPDDFTYHVERSYRERLIVSPISHFIVQPYEPILSMNQTREENLGYYQNLKPERAFV